MLKDKLSDSWSTPDDLFNVLDKGGVYQGIEFEGFNFDIDLTATKENSKCNLYCTDYLNNKYNNLAEEWPECGDIEFDNNANLDKYGDRPYYIKEITGWLNPPYSNPKTFIEKAWEDSKHCKIVALVKCDPSTQWWATFWEYESKSKVDMVKCPTCNGCGKYTWQQGTIGFDEDPCDNCNGKKTLCEKIIIPPGPKPNYEVLFFPKRIKFDPPQQLIDSGEVWLEPKEESVELWGDYHNQKTGLDKPKINIKLKRKWVQKCKECVDGRTMKYNSELYQKVLTECKKCKGKGYTPLSGPSFSCALIIMDRRNV